MTALDDREVAFLQSGGGSALLGVEEGDYDLDDEGFGLVGVEQEPSTTVEPLRSGNPVKLKRKSTRVYVEGPDNPTSKVSHDTLNRLADAFPLIRGTARDFERELAQRPHIVLHILNDMVEKVQAADKRKLGTAKSGRRVQVRLTAEQLQQRALGMEPSMDSFPVALRELVGDRPQHEFAQLMGTYQSVVSRLLSGRMRPHRWHCEAAAQAGQVPPWYFLEYREIVVTDWVRGAMRDHPNISLHLIGRLVQA